MKLIKAQKHAATALYLAFTLAACQAQPTHEEAQGQPSPLEQFNSTAHHKIIEDAKFRHKNSYPDIPVYIVDRSHIKHESAIYTLLKQGFGTTHWTQKTLKKHYEGNTASALPYYDDKPENFPRCLVFPASQAADARNIISHLSDDPDLAQTIPYENRSYIDHQALYHELGDCIQLFANGSNSGDRYTQTIADGLGIAMHVLDYGLNTAYPSRFSAYRELQTLNRVNLDGEYGSYAAGITYATHDTIRAIYDDIKNSPQYYKNQPLSNIFRHVEEIAESNDWPREKYRMVNRLTKTIALHMKEYNKEKNTNYHKFGHMPFSLRTTILQNVQKAMPESKNIIESYYKTYQTLSQPTTETFPLLHHDKAVKSEPYLPR